MNKKEIEKICKNCIAYDFENRKCKVVILNEGEKIHLPMDPNDKCFFMEEVIIKDKNGNVIDKYKPEIEQIKVWVENNLGQHDKNGVVKIEFPKTLDIQT